MASESVKSETYVLDSAPTHSTTLTLLTELLDPLSRQVWSPLFPFPILATLHALKVTLDYRARLRSAGIREQPPLLQGLFTVLTMALGGSTSAALLMGIPPSWLASNATLPTYALMYMAVFRSPGDIVFRLLDALDPVLRPILLLADGLTRANSQASFAIESIRAMPALQNSLVAYLLCGTLAGCGGGVIADTLNLTALEWGLRAPGAFRSEQYDLRVSVLSALTYSLTTTAPSEQVAMADTLLARVGATLPIGQLTLDPAEARCLAGLIFATAQLWRRYGQALMQKSTVEQRKEAAIRASKKHDQTEADDKPETSTASR